MKAGRESRNFSKSFEPRRKATRGACYRWHYVVDNASVFVFMYIGQRRHVRSTSATMAAATVILWTGVDPTSLACVSPCPRLACVVPQPPPPPVQACHVALFKWSRRLCLVSWWVWVLPFPSAHASPSSTACLLPPSLLSSCPLARQGHTSAQPPFLRSSVPFVRTSICRSGFGSE